MATQEPVRAAAQARSGEYQTERFQALVHERRSIVARLFVSSALFFFSIPFLATFYPDLLRIKVFGAINFGLLYAVSQYPIGGLIAYRYAVRMRRLDALVKDI